MIDVCGMLRIRLLAIILYVTRFVRRYLFRKNKLAHFKTLKLHNFFSIVYNSLKFFISAAKVSAFYA